MVILGTCIRVGCMPSIRAPGWTVSHQHRTCPPLPVKRRFVSSKNPVFSPNIRTAEFPSVTCSPSKQNQKHYSESAAGWSNLLYPRSNRGGRFIPQWSRSFTVVVEYHQYTRRWINGSYYIFHTVRTPPIHPFTNGHLPRRRWLRKPPCRICRQGTSRIFLDTSRF